MKRIFILSLALVSFSLNTFADSCTVADIKAHKLAGWKAFDSDDGKPLPQKRALAFEKSVDQFTLAEWSNHNGNTAAIHCLYRDRNGSDLEAYLTKGNLVPERTKSWYQVSGATQCAAGNERCRFTNIGTQPQLAKK